MVKGTVYTPSRDRDGIWFVHRTHQQHQEHLQQQQPQSAAVKREVDTSTGSMLTAPFNPRTAAYPPAPPQSFNKFYTDNMELNRSKSGPAFKFTDHDNRHSCEGSAEYFGNGRDQRTLGKRMYAKDIRFTSNDYLKHYGRQNVDFDYTTLYSTNYRSPLLSRDMAEDVTASSPSSTSAPAVSYRRFAKSYQPMAKLGQSHVGAESESWFEFSNDDQPSTSLHVLAAAQHKSWLARKQPLGAPRWKYSYRPPQPAPGLKSPFDRALDPWWLRVAPTCESGI